MRFKSLDVRRSPWTSAEVLGPQPKSLDLRRSPWTSGEALGPQSKRLGPQPKPLDLNRSALDLPRSALGPQRSPLTSGEASFEASFTFQFVPSRDLRPSAPPRQFGVDVLPEHLKRGPGPGRVGPFRTGLIEQVELPGCRAVDVLHDRPSHQSSLSKTCDKQGHSPRRGEKAQGYRPKAQGCPPAKHVG